MKLFLPKNETFWNITLLLSTIFIAFIGPALVPWWPNILTRLAYFLVYISALFAINKHNHIIIPVFFLTLIMEWVSFIFDFDVLFFLGRGLNVLFFLLVVIELIHQTATSKTVTISVILGSVIGYLLLGVIFSIFIGFIIRMDPSAYNVTIQQNLDSRLLSSSTSLYYSYMTMATVGYGDIVPLKPYTRSFASFIALSGQFYIAIIVAVLVGKFASNKNV